MIYKIAKFPQTYDDAQRDEAFRVAYVAATRAKKLCLWFAKPMSNDVVSSVPTDERYRVLMNANEALDYINACM